MKTREELQQEIDYLHQKIYYCKVNDMLYDMQKYEYELELLEEKISAYKLTNENINQLIDLNNESNTNI